MAKKENKTNKHFLKDFKAELKKVIWPTPKQLLNNTVAVLTIVLITALIVFVLDLAFEGLNKHGVNKVKEIVTSTNTTNETSQEQNTVDSEEQPSEESNETTENVNE